MKFIGWRIVGTIPNDPKYVMVIAPHTSILDMFIGKIFSWVVGIRTKIMIKKELFFFPINLFVIMWGGIPIDRKNPKSIVDQMVDVFAEKKKLILSIAPEGTRAKNSKWKSGFYRIAIKSNVPMHLITADFKKRTVGFLGEFIPTGNFEKDIELIKQRFKGISARHPSKFSIEKQ